MFNQAIFLMFSVLACSAWAQDEAEPPHEAALEWLSVNTVRAGDAASEVGSDEAALLDRIMGDARVIGFGEFAHFVNEPLDYRNRLIRYLVQHRGLTAVALESGIAQGRRIDAYIQGGDGDPVAIAKEYLSWGFGRLVANIELMQWLRAWNSDPANHTVTFYGIDLSGGDFLDSFTFASLSLQDVVAYLKKTGVPGSADLVESLSGFTDRFTTKDYTQYSEDERREIEALLDAVEQHVVQQRAAMIQASSADEYQWAERLVLDCQRLLETFVIWPEGDPRQSDEALAAMLEVSVIRDLTMADQTEWVLEREGSQGRVLLFAANTHLNASEVSYEALARVKSDVKVVGRLLRARLGDDYRVIWTLPAIEYKEADGSVIKPGSINLAISKQGDAPLLANLVGAPHNGWWNAIQSFAQTGRVVMGVPVHIVDGIYYLPQVDKDPEYRPDTSTD